MLKKIYYIAQDESHEFDSAADEMIIVAKDQDEARKIAMANCADEGMIVWQKTPTLSVIGHALEGAKSMVVMRHVRWEG